MKYTMTDKPTDEDLLEIRSHLRDYNLARIESTEVVPIVIYVDDDNGNKIGGISAETHGNWLSVSLLWVDEKTRGQQVGTKLLMDAEAEAIKRGCKYSFLDTFSFQAKGFYEKMGYQVVFTLDEYPLTSKRHYFTKNLV